MNNLFIRSLTGLVYVAVIILSLLLNPVYFIIVLVVLNFLSLLEFNNILTKTVENSTSWIYLNTLAIIAFLLQSYYLTAPQLQFVPIILFLVLLVVLSLYVKAETGIKYLSNGLFGTLYISFPLILLWLIHRSTFGMEVPFVLITFILIWINDTFAYLVGMAIGRHKLFERISPKKSWEGFFGGLLFSLITCFFVHTIFQELALWQWLVFGGITVVASVFGDLAESLLKRSANVKDSGNILPGHGGILDRIDSLLLVSPVIYIYLLLINL